MPRQRIGSSKRRPGNVKIGEVTRRRNVTPPQPGEVTVQGEVTMQGEEVVSSLSGATGRRWKSVPPEPLYMAEGEIIGGIEKGIGEPVEKGISFLYKVTRKAEGIARTALANNQYIADMLKETEDNVGSMLSDVRGRLK